MNDGEYIVVKNCRVSDTYRVYLRGLWWTYSRGEIWLITGGNRSGKEHFIAALGGVDSAAGKKVFAPEPGCADAAFESVFAGQSICVSLEEAAALIAEERRRDDSDYNESGADIGRTVREYLGEVARDNADSSDDIADRAAVKLTGIEKILDRGLKYLSTGEIRRVMLARALLSGKKLLVLSEPFAGLDAASRGILFEFFDKLSYEDAISVPRIILCADRYDGIPPSVNRVLEFRDERVTFNGIRADYEARLQKASPGGNLKPRLIIPKLEDGDSEYTPRGNDILIDMKNVNVSWGDTHVLKNLSWRVERGCHWFIRGPNGSGKTTLLELITGDNMQVFSNEVHLFGARRGSGETLWDIRKKLGIVSYRLHLEYRMVGGTAVEDVAASGFRDSIGLYESVTDFEKMAVDKWLSLTDSGFLERKREPFSSLSYGEQRALLILRATVKSAPLLILDEPCHGLDDDARSLVLGLLETIADAGVSTILHVTHDPGEMRGFEKNILELCPSENPMYKIIGV
ncbi:MAG: molybdate ABC transporter ATP-binding protein ModF [Treponemataceae bacterium]|nr:MAG: molybdate ABC transporter ATP-binding protein ModF [Treponemataceae bacterium]